MNFTNKIAVVTGGAMGIGEKTAEALSEKGAKVIIIDINKEEGQRVAENSTIMYYYCDLTNIDELHKVFTHITKEQGYIDILVNAAGLANRTEACDITEEEWDTLNDVNLKAVFFSAQLAAASMCKSANKHKRIVNIASIRAHLADGKHTIYDVTKAGVQAMTRSLAVAFAKDNITVNTVSPGYVLTPMTEHNLKKKDWLPWLYSKTPLGRMLQYEEVIAAILFFCSDDSSGITGQNLYVDGGWTISE